MKLLFITQKIDENDDVLGFVHGWLAEFSSHFSSIKGLCLYKGSHHLPDNVSVVSLGKENEVSRLTYITRFYSFIWNERKSYDAVFVHMNVEYILLGSLFWRLTGKRVVLWYNHTYGDWKGRLAMKLANKVCHTSPYAFTAGTSKSVIMPAGINTRQFAFAENNKEARSILYIGRIARVKKVDLFVRALRLLHEKGIDFMLHLYGKADDVQYKKELDELALPLVESSKLQFCGSVANKDASEIFARHQVSVNLTPAGNFDKTVLESMACGCIPVVSSKAFVGIVSPECITEEDNPEKLAEKIQYILALPESRKIEMRKEMRSKVEREHGLGVLAEKIRSLMEHNRPI